MNCGTCKHWKYDKHDGAARIGFCSCPVVLYRYINPFAWRDDLNLAGVGRKESDKCEEYESADI